MGPAERIGHCLGCGQHCCSTVVIPLTKTMGDAYLAQQPVWALPTGDEDYVAWLRLHGIDGERMFVLPVGTSYSVIDDGHERVPVATIPRRCRELQADGSCGIHDKPERPRMCGDWPWEPMQLKALSYQGQQACGYSFEMKGK